MADAPADAASSKELHRVEEGRINCCRPRRCFKKGVEKANADGLSNAAVVRRIWRRYMMNDDPDTMISDLTVVFSFVSFSLNFVCACYAFQVALWSLWQFIENEMEEYEVGIMTAEVATDSCSEFETKMQRALTVDAVAHVTRGVAGFIHSCRIYNISRMHIVYAKYYPLVPGI
jgi:hypothetical protein